MYAYSRGVPLTNRSRTTSKVGVLDPARLVERRLALGLLQKEVAARAGISPQHMADIEAGRRYGSPPVRLAIAKALRTSLTDLQGAA
jgi:transcriptional regulator with XRE-family HTH domain